MRPVSNPAAPIPASPASLLARPVVADQAAKLRAMTEGQPTTAPTPTPPPTRSPVMAAVPQPPAPQPRRAEVVAVTSGKGGVGKSNVAVNLAILLARGGRRVILLDADLGLANADVLLNVRATANLAHVVARQKELRDVLVEVPITAPGEEGGPTGGGLGLIGGASGLAKMADLSDLDRQRLVASLGELERQADVIVIDTGAGISPGVLSFTRAADHVLVVTTPEPTAITDAYAAIKVLVRQPGASPAALNELATKRISLLVNMARSEEDGVQVYERIAQTAKQFLGVSVYDAGHVLRDDAVPASVRRRMPLVLAAPRSNAARCLTRLATRFGQGDVPPGRPSFFDRLSRWMRKQG